MKVALLGALGRDIHNYFFLNKDKRYNIKAFILTQLPIEKKFIVIGKRKIRVYREEQMQEVAKKVDFVILSYSDLTLEELNEKISQILKCTNFAILGTETQTRARQFVISVCATRTGSGKTTVTKEICRILRESGKKFAVVRHPMPYLSTAEVQKFESEKDLEGCTIEEREEYEQYVREGFKIYSGTNMQKICDKIKEGIIVYEGGNNDFSLIRPNYLITVCDPTREINTFPGLLNLLLADLIIITKADAVKKERLKDVIRKIRTISKAKAILSKFILSYEKKGKKGLKGKKAIIIEDGPSSTHGGIREGAGKLAARKLGIKIINPKKHCKGIIAQQIEKYNLDFIPAIGYDKNQIEDLRESIKHCEKKCDFFIISTQASIEKMFDLKNYLRVTYNLDSLSRNLLKEEIKKQVKDF
jgi:predicted GTPase